MDYTSYYEEKYRSGEEIAKESKRLALAYVPREGALDILDLGCGTGMNSQYMSELGHNVQGIDVAAEAIRKYNERGFQGQVMDVEKGLSFEDESFDLVFSTEVIEHLVQHDVMLQEAYRVLRPGGRLVLSTPNSAFWVYRLASLVGKPVSELQHPMHLRFFSQSSLRKVMEETGFEIERSCGHNMYLLLPDPPGPLHSVFRTFGMQREFRYTNRTHFWHLSHLSSFSNPLFAATLIFVAQKPA